MSRKKVCLVLLIIFALNIALIFMASDADAASYKRGSSGETVSKIQELSLIHI